VNYSTICHCNENAGPKHLGAMYIYPNPVKSKLHFIGAVDLPELSIFDISGALRLKKNLTDFCSVQLSGETKVNSDG